MRSVVKVKWVTNCLCLRERRPAGLHFQSVLSARVFARRGLSSASLGIEIFCSGSFVAPLHRVRVPSVL